MAYPLILYFSSPFCAPCKNVERMLNEINVSLFGNKLRIKKIDVAREISIAQKYNVISVPTIIIGGIRLSVIIDKNELTDAILQGFISSVSFAEEDGIDPEPNVMEHDNANIIKDTEVNINNSNSDHEIVDAEGYGHNGKIVENSELGGKETTEANLMMETPGPERKGRED